MTEAPNGIFDSWINFPSETGLAPDPNIERLFKDQAAGYKEGHSVDQIVAAMDKNGVASGLLTKVERRVTGPFIPALDLDDEKVSRGCAEVREVMDAYPGRFLGSILLDPRLGYAATRHVRIAVEEYGMAAVRIMPAFALLPPNDALYYPMYTTACDLGIPVTINVGMPGPHKPAKYQDPMHLDEVALTFPDLKIVMTHVGEPWIEEVVTLLNRRPNMYLMTSGWAPKYVPAQIRKFMSSRGKGKVMWASDYPVLPMERTVSEGKALDVSEEALAGYLGANAIKVFGQPH